jgi:multidrug efflux pump subunit AcrB
MDLTDQSLRNPGAVAVIAALVCGMGIAAMLRLPVQLFPDIDRPVMNIGTGWRAASPKEVESEVLEPQEEALQGLPGLTRMDASAFQGFAQISLEFELGTDMQQTLIEVISRMNRVQRRPVDAQPPVITLGEGGLGGAGQTLSWFFIQQLPGNPKPIEEYQRFIEDQVVPRIEAVPGVADAQAFYGAPEELRVTFDPYRAAQLGVPVSTIAGALSRQDDAAGGQVEIGRRQYTLRFAGRFAPEEMRDMVLEWRDGHPVTLGDVATVEVQRGDRANFSIQNGNPAIGMQVTRQTGANALATLNEVKRVVAELAAGPLQAEGLDMRQSFDSALFISRAINMVTGNLLAGIILAIGVLWWFIRSWRATLIIAIAMPISLLGVFIVLHLTGRTLNVISLAGLAFASGMVMDAAIVVLENVVRLREKGLALGEACARGASEVVGALFASTATSIAIFLPVIFLEDAEGQLFADLALTIAISVAISMLVAVTVLPSAALRWLGSATIDDAHARVWERIGGWIVRATDDERSRRRWIAGLMAVPIAATVLLMPRLDYLPAVKRAAIDTFFDFPAGAGPRFIEEEVVAKVVERMAPYMRGEEQPALLNYYVIVWPGGGTMGSRVVDPDRIGELERLVRDEITKDLPDTDAFSFEGNLFGGFGGNRSISMDIQSQDAAALRAAAKAGPALIATALPGAQARPFPDPEVNVPELRLTPDDRRIQEVGLTRAAVGDLVRALGDGLWVGEHFDGDRKVDVILRSGSWDDTAELAAVPVATPRGGVVSLGELVRIERTVGPSTLRRVDGRRTVTLNVNPPDGVALEDAIATLKREVEPQLLALMPDGSRVRYGGSADSLSKAIVSMGGNFLMALGILFLIMAGLFRSARDSALVMLTIPLATVGGVVALRLLNLFVFTPVDLLTMIGFVILLGVVVNNAILLVHQTREGEREGLERRAAVSQAIFLRLRPIFSSTFTGVVGMLPLVFMPGAGSEIYRGLATVIVGGQTVSTVFTLLLLPCFLRLGEPELATRTDPAGGSSAAALQQPA